MRELRTEIAAFVRACHAVDGRNLVRCSSGNLSWRVKGGRVLIKASRVWMAETAEADVSVCRMADGRLLCGRPPSVETALHLAVLRNRPDMNVVLHFQTPFATALACRSGRPPDYRVLPEIPFYIGAVATVPYYPPGSSELADAVSEALARRSLVQMQNHGQVTVARDFAHAIQNACFFELACEVIVRNGGRTRVLPREAFAAGSV
jgi:ribulose-5-phosphate 4-epimerase/fuculose-1-phosphate aldolase